MYTKLSGLTIAYTPKLLSIVTDAIYAIVNVKVVGYINGIVYSTVSFLSIALMFIAIKGLITPDEDEDKVFRKVAVIAVAAFAILKVLSICGIY